MPHPGSLIPSSADPPRNYPGLRLWLRADLGVTLSGSKVAALADQSGNGANAVQAVAGSRPVWSATSGPNNQAGMTFAGGQLLSVAAFDPLGSTQVDVFAVINPAESVGALWADYPAGVTTAGTFDAFYLTAGNYRGDHYDAVSFNGWFSINTTGAQLVEFRHNRNAVAQEVFVLTNGVLRAQTQVNGDPLVGTFTAQNLSIGSLGDGSLPMTGVISELIIYNILLNTQERQNIVRYLGNRYAITVP